MTGVQIALAWLACGAAVLAADEQARRAGERRRLDHPALTRAVTLLTGPILVAAILVNAIVNAARKDRE